MPSDLLPLLVLGDSHSQYFLDAYRYKLFSPRKVDVCVVHGATASGLQNPNSFTAAAGRFRKFLSGKPKNSIVAFHLGEVDCGILIWLRTEKNSTDLSTEIDRSVAAYFSFVDEVIASGFSNVIITGATLPTITDDDQIGEVVNQRRSKIRATQRERTDLTFRFNACLRHEAEQRRLPYVDVAEDVIDADTGLVERSFRNKNPADHHMDSMRAALIWSRRLHPVLEDNSITMPSIRIWQASVPTYIKVLSVESRKLPADMKISVEPGEQIEGRPWNRSDRIAVLSNAKIGGRFVKEKRCFIYEPHWIPVRT